jgi:PAS domain S-box-containing protein
MTLNAVRVECGTLGTDGCAYRAVAEQLPDVAVFAFDRDLRFELATGAAVRDTGWRPEEILGRTILELLPPDQAERYATPWRAALAAERQSFEVQGWRKPGKVWAVDVLPIRGADGAITGGMVFSTDVTERRRTERELRERRRQLAEAQRIARVGNWEWDLVSGTGSASAEWFRVVGDELERAAVAAGATAYVARTPTWRSCGRRSRPAGRRSPTGRTGARERPPRRPRRCSVSPATLRYSLAGRDRA